MAAGPVIAHVSQLDGTTLEVRPGEAPANAGELVVQIEKMLGLNNDLAEVHMLAESIGWLRPLARRWLGVRPARTASLWEAGATAIIYQSVSMLAAGAVIERFIERFGARLADRPFALTLFPTPQLVSRSTLPDLLTVGLSRAKVHALHALAAALVAGEWDAYEIELLSTAAACERFMRVRGIGPWTAAVVALRGLGRLDVFPMRDSGVVRTIGLLAVNAPNAAADALARLGEKRGMLYHYLLLARLEARGKLAPQAAR